MNVPRPRFVAVGLAAVMLAACGTTHSTSSAIPAGPGGITNAAGPYPVVRLIDPATITLDRGRHGGLSTVRLLGVVAPGNEGPASCYSAEAMTEAHRLLDGQAVRVVGDPGPGRIDATGLPLVYVWLDSGRMANDLLVEGGLAREATGVGPYLYRPVLARSEALARANGRGLWSPTTCDGNLTASAGR